MPATETVPALPDDVAELQAMVAALREQLEADRREHDAALVAERAKGRALLDHIALLEQQLATLRRNRYGRRSEQRDAEGDQLELSLEELEASVGELPELEPEERPPVAPRPRPRRRQTLPPELPRENIVHGATDACRECGGAVTRIGEDVSEQLEYRPASFRVIRHVRPKYGCRCCSAVMQAPAPSRPIERGLAGPALLAHVAVAKFADHLPLYRQSAIYAREGGDVVAVTAGGLARAGVGASSPARRRAPRSRAVGEEGACRRHTGAGTAARSRRDEDGPAVGLRA